MRNLKISTIILACLFGLCPVGSADTPSSISANFNGTALGGGDYIWFSSVLKPSGLGTKPVTIFVRNSTIVFSANGTTYTVSVPDSNVTFSPSCTSATTTFISAQNLWQTTVPSTGLAGNILLDAAEFHVPQGGLPGGIQNVTWKSNFSTDTAGITLQWQWGAALYTSFSTDYNAVGVKPVDDNKASQYQNSDHAGTPENLKGYVTGGTTGGGGSNYTGGLSGTGSTTVAVNQIPTANPGGPYSGVVGQAISFSGAGSSDADGDQLTYSWTFGDGTTATGVSPSHTYMTAGTFTVTLTVNDGRNDTASASTSASVVLPAAPPPPAIAAQISPLPNSKGWNNSPVVVTFTCTSSSSTIASCTSPITVSTQGANQSVRGTATDTTGKSTTINVPLNIDLTAPGITASASPSPNAGGWVNSAATVYFQCSDSLSGIAQCPGPQTVSTEGANQTISGTAVDVAGNISSTSVSLNIDLTPPVVSVSSPADGTVINNNKLLVSGTASDSLSGLADVVCNGLDATISGNIISCRVTLAVGANSIQVQAFDVAGNSAATSLNVTYTLSPPPSALFLTPDHFAMALNETRKLALVDDLARAIPASNWTLSDPTVAQVGADGTVTPLTAGTVTITASYQALTATAQLIVYGTQAFPPATVRWTVQPLPGDSQLGVFPGQATTPDDPAAYFVESSGAKLFVRAFTSDGRQTWIQTILPTLGSGARALLPGSPRPSLQRISTAVVKNGSVRPHRWGKKITAFLNKMKAKDQNLTVLSARAPRLTPAAWNDSNNSARKQRQQPRLQPVQSSTSVNATVLSLAVTDAGNQIINTFERPSFGDGVDNIIVSDANGNELWRKSILGGEMGYALHPSGIVYILQADYINNSTFTLFAMDETTGTAKFSIQLPFSYGGQLQPFPGLPSVFPDGNLYLPVETAADGSSPDVLQLLKVSPDGTSTWYPVTTAPQCFGPVIEAHEPIPDGQGNLLLTWDYFGNGTFCGESGTQVVHMSSSGQVLEQIQLSPLTRLASYFSDNDGDGVLGQQHLFVAGSVAPGQPGAVGLNLSTSSIDLNWQPPGGPCMTVPCPEISLVGVAPGDQLLVKQTGNADGSSNLTAITPGNNCPSTCAIAASVPNATLLAFDLSGTVFSPTFETFFSTDDFFCTCVIPSSASGGSESIGGAVSAPDPNTVPAPDSLPPWPQVAMNDTRKALPISIKVKFDGGKTEGDKLSFLKAQGPCFEDLGLKDCSQVEGSGYWLWNLEARAPVYDNASNWTVLRSGQFHERGLYVDDNNNLQPFSCTVNKPNDGPKPDYLQNPAGQKLIFAIDAPGPFHAIDSASPCVPGTSFNFSPIYSATIIFNFQLKFTNTTTGYHRKIYYYVKIVIGGGHQLDRTASKADYGNVSLNF